MKLVMQMGMGTRLEIGIWHRESHPIHLLSGGSPAIGLWWLRFGRYEQRLKWLMSRTRKALFRRVLEITARNQTVRTSNFERGCYYRRWGNTMMRSTSSDTANKVWQVMSILCKPDRSHTTDIERSNDYP